MPMLEGVVSFAHFITDQNRLNKIEFAIFISLIQALFPRGLINQTILFYSIALHQKVETKGSEQFFAENCSFSFCFSLSPSHTC